MYQASEAICRAGEIEPLEPVQFEENEHLVIVRLPVSALISKPTPTADLDWHNFVGRLQTSPNWQGDPSAIQKGMRDEWD